MTAITEINVMDRMFDALVLGDLKETCACFTEDAEIWHCFDRIVQSPEQAAKDWEVMIAHFPKRSISDIRRQATEQGFVQQHLWSSETVEGKKMAWPVCVVVKTQDGLIARLDEYIDRAGSFAPE